MSTSASNLLLASRGEHRDGTAFAVAGDGDVPRIDVVALRQPLDHGRQVVGVVLQGDAFAASAALADAALVVAQHDEALLCQRTGKLRKDRNAGDRLRRAPPAPEPATSTTAGWLRRPTPVGMVSVPARLNPAPG